MLITYDKIDNFKLMLDSFAKKHGLFCNIVKYDEKKKQLYFNFVHSKVEKAMNYAVDFNEVASLSDAGANIFASAIRAFGLDGYPPSGTKAPVIKNVIFNDPATIVFWEDGTKTVVKTQGDDVFDPEKGLAMAISKKALGNKGNYFNEIKKWTEKYDVESDYPNSLPTVSFEECVKNLNRYHMTLFHSLFRGEYT